MTDIGVAFLPGVKMKSEERNYIADIERYFLGLAGKGLMLSARDYGFIRELGRKSVSKEMVIKAIAYGFEQRRQRGLGEPRGLFNIRQEVEDYLRVHSSPEVGHKEPVSRDAAFARSRIIEQALRRLDSIIIEEKKGYIRKRYQKLRSRVREIDGTRSANIYKQFDSLWRDFIEDIFLSLPARRREQITDAALSRLPAQAGLYDEDARRKTLNAFRDEIICESLSISNVFTK